MCSPINVVIYSLHCTFYLCGLNYFYQLIDLLNISRDLKRIVNSVIFKDLSKLFTIIVVSVKIILPSCWSTVKSLFRLGVFMKIGNTVRRPRISTNLLQLSRPSGPINAWSNTFNEPFRDNFFSLQLLKKKIYIYILLET